MHIIESNGKTNAVTDLHLTIMQADDYRHYRYIDLSPSHLSLYDYWAHSYGNAQPFALASYLWLYQSRLLQALSMAVRHYPKKGIMGILILVTVDLLKIFYIIFAKSIFVTNLDEERSL